MLRRNASIRTREGWGLLKFRVVFTLGVRIHLHVEALLGEPVPESCRARRELGLLFLGRPARWVLPFTASPLPPPLHGQPIQCLSCSRRMPLRGGSGRHVILATSEAGILRARPNSRLFSSPSLPLMYVPHGLEGQVRGKRREVDRKCSIQPHPSLDEASQATGPGWGVAGGREENKRSPLAEYCHLSVTKVNLQPFRTQ